MPGNEVGDRVHNFFGQENLSQGQHHSQAGHGNWHGLNNNPLVGNQRQFSASSISDLKNYNVQQSGINKFNKLTSYLVSICLYGLPEGLL